MNPKTTNRLGSGDSKFWMRICGAAGAMCLFAGLPADLSAQSIVIGPDVPHDIEVKPPSDAYEVELAQFAWQQFVALGWQATYDPANKNFERGVADPAWKGSGTPRYAVWETFAHRSELRPWATSLTGRNFSSLPDYLTQVRANGSLKQGKDSAGNPADLTLLDNLDEDSEIGSCSIYLGKLTDPSTQPLVMFQAKVNRDEYEYIQNVFPDQFDPNGALAKAATNNKTNVKAIKAYFKGADGKPDFNTCGPPDNVKPNAAITLPCGATGGAEGTIEVKTAFYKIPDGQEAQFANFFVRNAIYYTEGLNKDGTGNGIYTYNNANFALLAIHIIHKTKNYPGFIFTSFENKALGSLGPSAPEFRLLSPLPPLYSNFNPHGAKVVPPNAGDGTQIGDEIPIVRQTGPNPTSNGQLYPVPTQFGPVNAAAQKQLAALDSIWQNYQLIGVQAYITQSYAASPNETVGPNHFMANFVIESDTFLGNFFGPGFGSNPFPTGKGNGNNILSQGKTYNMGGCKGCHGVAQTSFGTDFSFLLDVGFGKPVAQPDTIYYIKPPLKTAKARFYLSKLKKLKP